QIDIARTVLNFLNFDKPYFAFGFDAFASDSTNFVVNNNGTAFNFYQGDYLLVSDGEKSTALYNLKTDRMLKENRINTMADLQYDIENRLKAFIQQYNNRTLENDLTAD